MKKISKHNFKKDIIISLVCGFIFTTMLSFISFEAQCQQIRKSIFRIHILANSDSVEDQNLKLKVRDKILTVADELFSETKTLNQAVEIAQKNIENLLYVSKKEIADNGYNYDVSMTIDKQYFDTRKYNDFSLPAGEYLALRVVIGEGKGQNWWCVMFPAVCIPAAGNSKISDVMDSKQTDIVTNETKYRIKFKTVEIFEEIRRFFSNNFNK